MIPVLAQTIAPWTTLVDDYCLPAINMSYINMRKHFFRLIIIIDESLKEGQFSKKSGWWEKFPVATHNCYVNWYFITLSLWFFNQQINWKPFASIFLLSSSPASPLIFTRAFERFRFFIWCLPCGLYSVLYRLPLNYHSLSHLSKSFVETKFNLIMQNLIKAHVIQYSRVVDGKIWNWLKIEKCSFLKSSTQCKINSKHTQLLFIHKIFQCPPPQLEYISFLWVVCIYL